MFVKTIIKIKLKTDTSGKNRLLATMEAFNAACDDIAATCFQEQTGSKFYVQELVYHNIRQKHNLSSQLTVRAIAKTCEAYKLNKTIQPTFKPHGSITYDQRNLSFRGLNGNHPQVSLTTLDGRRSFDLEIRDYFVGRVDHIQGQVDLVYRDNQFYLYATCELPEGTPIDTEDCLGVDLGVKNISTDSTGEVFSNAKMEQARVRTHKHRSKLQRKNTKSSKRRLKKTSGKERRFRTDVNHCISKHLVEKAKDTHCVIALEDLTNINKRTTVRKSQRAERLSWSFYQLRMFVDYKAKLAGVPVILVDPRNTSRQCNSCGHIAEANRRNQAEFRCVSCGYSDNADMNAAKNIRTRGLSTVLLSSATDLSRVA